MQLHLIRHTAVNLPKGICYGVSDVLLKDSWEEEAELIKQELAAFNITRVYSSPLMRCRLLAEKISAKVIFDDRLKELNFGSWELKHWDEIAGPMADRWMNDFVNVCCPEGESYKDMSIRISAFLKDLARAKKKEIAIVSHAGVIRTILSLLQNIPLEKSFGIDIAHGQIIHSTFY
jgi:alpha-ribazole phosphatase